MGHDGSQNDSPPTTKQIQTHVKQRKFLVLSIFPPFLEGRGLIFLPAEVFNAVQVN